MSLIVVTPPTSVAAPQPVPPSTGGPAPFGPRLTATWTSWTGESWEITDPRSPVFAVEGWTGLRGSEVTHWWQDAPGIDGSAWTGMRVARGEIFGPVRIDGASHAEFVATHEAFMRSLDPLHESTLRITTPDGTWREIACRYESGMDAPIQPDPVLVRRATYEVTWTTADPFWRSEPVSSSFSYGTLVDLFPGPPFAINPSNSLSSSRFTNSGDVASYPVWRVNGPFTGFSVGVGDAVVAMTLTKTAGGWVEIDMSPRARTILDESGTDQWLAATAAEFASLDPGANVPLTTAVSGAAPGTSVDLSFTPRYRSAW